MTTIIPTSKNVLLLPAAGYGTRVKANDSSGKELMVDPIAGVPLIIYAIELGLKAGMHVVVASRASKLDLNLYITKRYLASMVTLDIHPDPKPGHEWPDTILQSFPYWGERTIVMLPDTRFSMPYETLKAMQADLVRNPLSIATFKVAEDEASKFAMISGQHLCEKPSSNLVPMSMRAMGLWGFRREEGQSLFSGLSTKKWFAVDAEPAIVRLEWFKDITRNGIIEGYPNVK
jgi:hypothetical protein